MATSQEDALVLFKKFKEIEGSLIEEMMSRRCEENNTRVLDLFRPIMDLQRQMNEALVTFTAELLKMEIERLENIKKQFYSCK